MKRYLALMFVVCLGSAGLVLAQTKPSPAEDAVVKADRALGMAYAKGDTSAVAKMLDPDFSWIDTDGIMTERTDVLRAGFQMHLAKPIDPAELVTTVAALAKRFVQR